MSAKIIGGNPEGERDPNDYYPTPAEVTWALVNWMGGLKGQTVWEPACGQGHMAEVLEAAGARVIATELNGQGYGKAGVNFLTTQGRACDWIITNPPFNCAEAFILRCIWHRKPFAMLLKSQYWHAASRTRLFMQHRPTAVLPLTWRPDFKGADNGGGSPMMDLIWTVWSSKPSEQTIYQPLIKAANENKQFRLEGIA